MGYAALPTKSPGDVLTSALWNTYLQGNADSGFMRMLADSTLVGAQASFDFTSIPATFAHLLLVAYLRGDTAATTVAGNVRLNNDSGANYTVERLQATGSTVTSLSAAAATSMALTGNVAAASATANSFTALVIEIPHYAQASNSKVAIARAFYAGSPLIEHSGGYWSAVAAINRITLLPGSGNFVAGSRVTLYGLPA